VNTEGARITVATFNIWFDQHHARERHDAIMGLLEARRPDVIALQEVTSASLALVLAKPWIRAEYQPSDVDGRTLDRYGVVLLSRIPTRRMTLLPLPSGMGRKLLVFELEVDGMTVNVATVHLESLKESDARGVQLGLIFEHLDASEHAILMGDFNFCSSWAEENARIRPEYLDVWPAVRPDHPGYGISARTRRSAFDSTASWSSHRHCGRWTSNCLARNPSRPTNPTCFHPITSVCSRR